MAIVWGDAYATHVGSIDRQHQKLFAYINKLENFVEQNIYEGEDVNDLLGFLTDYVVMHFSHEEFCMKKVSCPAADKNKKAHDEFIKFYTDFKDQYGLASSADRQALLQKLQKVAEDWLTNHICKIDISLRSYADKLN